MSRCVLEKKQLNMHLKNAQSRISYVTLQAGMKRRMDPNASTFNNNKTNRESREKQEQELRTGT